MRFRREPGLLGIIGNPVRASLSPAMQQAALRHLKLDACYRAFEIAPDQVRAVLRALPLLGFWGVNVTIPYKEKVLPLLDEVDDVAGAIGAVNTVVVREGRLLGYNTDAEGFRMALETGGRTDLARRPGARRRRGRRGARGGVRLPGPRLPLVADRQPLRSPGAVALPGAAREFPRGRHRRRRDRGAGLAAPGRRRAASS